VKPISMKTIAEKAGVSRPTVSEILNHKPNRAGSVRISNATREKVIKIARELNFQPNYFAQSLKTGKTHIIGVTTMSGTLQQFNNPYIGHVYKGIGNNFLASDYKLIFQNFDELSRSDMLRKWVSGGLVDGLILLLFSYEWEYFKKDKLAALQETGIPLVVIHSNQEDLGIPAVGTDCIRGGRTAVLHLIGHGYETIGFVGYKGYLAHCDNLLAGYKQAMRENGWALAEDFIYLSDGMGLEDGYRLAADLITGGKKLPRALVVAEEKIALGMIKRFGEAGVRIPEVIALIGFGNLYHEALDVTGLTVITQPAEEKGKMAAALLTLLIDQEKPVLDVNLHIIEPKLMIRTSCGCKKNC
jgi:LacI family transcriptional regulator